MSKNGCPLQPTDTIIESSILLALPAGDIIITSSPLDEFTFIGATASYDDSSCLNCRKQLDDLKELRFTPVKVISDPLADTNLGKISNIIGWSLIIIGIVLDEKSCPLFKEIDNKIKLFVEDLWL